MTDVMVGDRRGSASPLGHALIVIGDMWAVRILRAVHTGQTRFQELQRGLEISDPVLSRRLRSMVADGLLTTREYQAHPPRNEYLLTEPGKDLWQVLLAMWLWDSRHAGLHHEHARVRVRHRTCGHEVTPIFTCRRCGALGLTIRDVRGAVDDRLLEDVGTRRSRRSTTVRVPIDSAGVLGDRWSTLILSDAFLGSRRFTDFQQTLNISPVTLAQRLVLFTDAGILDHAAAEDGWKRRVYGLTPKGADFFVVTTMINAWAQRWLSDDDHSGLSLVHWACGHELLPGFTCNMCHQLVLAGQLHLIDSGSQRRGVTPTGAG